VAGAAYYANMNRVRSPTTIPSDMPAWALKVKTYAASLAGGVARVEVKIPGTGTSTTNPAKYVYITPEGLWASATNTKRMPAAMLTFQSISASSTHGAFVVTWNDSQFGGDYDMDIAGYLRYDILGSSAPYRLKVTTDIINVGAGWTGSHGFSIIGTSGFDGRYLTHRHNSDDSQMSGALGYLCGNSAYNSSTNLATTTLPSSIPAATGNGSWACNVQSAWNAVNDRDSPVTLTFDMIGAESVILRDPLWYAAKYGSFNPTNATSTTELPDAASKWDARRNDGKACGGTTGLSCQDGEPDGYFLARRPELLEQQLRDTLETIINTTNSAPAVSSSQLSAGGFKYVATFEPSQNSGSVLAYVMDSAGQFASNPSWDVGLKLTQVAAASRVVITNDSTTGLPLRTTTSFSSGYQSALTGSGAGSITTAQATELIDYTRGERSRERLNGGIWRNRSVSNIMGTVINSSPWLQSLPSAQNLGVLPSGAPSYSSFISAQVNRDRLLWVGANDGMLHGFKSQGANGGAPVLSYLPSPLVDRLRALSQDSSQVISGMDGSPYTGDVLTGLGGSSPAWKTYLFSSLGRGGRAVFALDVTSPSTLTETNAPNIFKWMFSSADDSDLGYVLGDTQVHPISNQASSIVRMNNDKYAILVSNGMGSTSGKAFLYVLFVDGPTSAGTWTAGTHYIKIPTDNLTGNGLMGANWADTNNDGKVDIIYGTDAKGRLWKFDVSSTNSSNWKSAFPSSGTPTPLFTATSGTNNLSISTAPVLTFPSGGGVMIGFGTGSAIASGDFPDTAKTQRFYSIYDRLDWSSRSLPNSDLSTLVPRTVVRDSSGNVYVSAGNTAFNPTTKDGWYINFPALASSSTANNEMVLSSPQLRSDIIFFTTVRPKAATADQCYTDPEGTLYAVDPMSGTPKVPLLGTISLVVNGQTIQVNKIGIGLSDQKITIPVKSSGTKGNFKIVGQKSNIDLPEFLRLMRRQWREIPGMRTDQ
jgi:type IV pilus assembly protein PilY1